MQPTKVTITEPSRWQVLQAVRRDDAAPVRWAYLGESVSGAIACSRWLNGKGERIFVGGLLQEVAQKCRHDFIEYIGDLSHRYYSKSWWLSSLSEKNPYVSRVFLRSCYVLVAERMASAAEGGALLFVVEDAVVRRCLEQHLQGRLKGELRFLAAPGRALLLRLDEVAQFWLRRLWFMVRHLSRLFLAKVLDVGPQGSWAGIGGDSETGVALIHNWVDGRSFKEDGTYQSINFGDLARHLAKQGRRFAIVPHILGTLSFRRGLRSLIGSGIPFLLPEMYLTPMDVLRAAFTGSTPPRSRTWPLFNGIDISDLILADQRRDWMRARHSALALIETTVRRWRDAGILARSFVYTFENHTWEKAYCQAFREHYPEAILIGYQDAHLPEMVLNFFVSRRERSIAPLPDVLIANGRHSFGLLKNSGYDPSMLRCGGALRYQYLMKSMSHDRESGSANHRGHGPGCFVLVTPSISDSLACELVWKVREAFKEETNIRVMLKCHPSLPFSILSSRLGIDRLPAHFEVSERPVQDLLAVAGVLIYMDSTTCLEALAKEVPVIHVASDFGLDFDPLSGHPEVRQSVHEPEQLREAIISVLSTDSTSMVERIERGRQLMTHFFGPLDESFYRTLLGYSTSVTVIDSV